MQNNKLNDIFINLWTNFLNSPPPKKLSELWKEHIIIFDQMSIVIKNQKFFVRSGFNFFL